MIRFDSFPSQNLPRLVLPATPTDGDARALTDWVMDNRNSLLEVLHEYGALLFRGFSFDGPDLFQRFVATFNRELLSYSGGNTPRTKVKDKVYTSTEFPADQKLSVHNEASYLRNMPELVFFYCDIAPRDRGQTPLADCREILRNLDLGVRKRFTEKKIRYINNLHSGYGFGKSWKTTFETEDVPKVEGRLRADGYKFSWNEDEGLHTEIVCDATRRHPVSGEEAWVNQAEQWHVSMLDEETRTSLLEMMEIEELPHHATFGDGSPMDEGDLAHIRQVTEAAEVCFDWEKGDLLICDNTLVAHGRAPFSGPRRILVAMV